MLQMKKSYEERIRSLEDFIVQITEGGTKHEGYLKQILEVITNHASVSQKMRLDILEIKPQVADIHFYTSDTRTRMIISAIAPKTSPEKQLIRGRSFAKRNQPGDTIQNAQALLSHLRQWYMARTPATIIVQAAPRAQSHAKDLAVEAVDYLRSRGKTVFFVLSQRSAGESASLTDICKNLVHQALNQQADFVKKNPRHFQFEKLNDSHNEQEWLALLALILATIPESFIIIETEDLFRMYKSDSTWLSSLLQSLQTLRGTVADSGSILKVMLVNNRRLLQDTGFETAERDIIIHTVEQHIVPVRSRRRMDIPTGHEAIWPRLESTSRTSL